MFARTETEARISMTYRLTGTRVGLRSLDASDANGSYFDWLQEPEVVAALASQKFPTSRDGLAAYISENTDNQNVALFGICELANDRLVGTIRLSVLDPIARIAGVGILIGDPSARGKGLAKEALQLVTAYGFDELNLHKICAGVASGNAPSLALFRHVMIEEGTRREQVFANGSYQDEHMFAIFQK